MIKTGISLFTGIKGFEHGMRKLNIRVKAYCEINPFCRQFIRVTSPGATIFGDITRVTTKHLRLLGDNDILFGGFPCQDLSCAGKGAGLDGTRSGLWWEMRRVINEVRPRWVLVENVPALRNRGADAVLASLEEIEYACWPLVVGAWTCGARHKRDRVFIVAYRYGKGRSSKWIREVLNRKRPTRGHHLDGCSSSRSVGDTYSIDLEPSKTRSKRRTVAAITGGAEPGGAGIVLVPDSESARRKTGGGGGSSGVETQEPRPSDGGPTLAVARPGEEQHEWEAPRSSGRYLNPDWVEQLMGYPKGWTDIRGAGKRARLQALGNSVVPQVIEIITDGINEIDKLLNDEEA